MLLYRRLLHAIDNHGPRGAAAQAFRRVIRMGTEQPATPYPAVHPFDLAHAVQTSGYISGESLPTGSSVDLYNTAYWAISPSTLTQAFAYLPYPQLDPARFTFVDLGCGKGRALLLAAQQGFRAVLGVEISPALAAVARSNTAGLPNVEIRIGDASTLAYPPGPLLVFLYHPFLAPVLRRVLRNLLRQQNESPRDFYLLFANPTYGRIFKRFPAFQERWHYSFALSPEDAAADRHGITHERYVLYHAAASPQNKVDPRA